MIETLVYILIAHVVGIAVGYRIGRAEGVDNAMKAARAEIAKMQGERLKRSEARLKEAVDRMDHFTYPQGDLKYPADPKGETWPEEKDPKHPDEICPHCGANSAEVVFAPIYKWKDDMSGLSGEIQCIGCGQTFTPSTRTNNLRVEDGADSPDGGFY